MKVVICHFKNEEFLLQYWLRHHRNLFDHGVMIDYDSTDSSAAIVRSVCPRWEVVRSRVNHWFDAAATDVEVMDHEGRFPGCWKMALNVTEFLLHWDLDEVVSGLPPGCDGVLTQGYLMYDPPELRGSPLDGAAHLVFQRRHGVREDDHISRSRLLHRKTTGAYQTGRHRTNWPGMSVCRDLPLLWYYWSPYEEMKRRGMAINAYFRSQIIARGGDRGFKPDEHPQVMPTGRWTASGWDAAETGVA